MILHPPFSISARLLPALRLPDGGTIQLEYSRRPGDTGRTRYKWTIDLPDSGGTAGGEDLQSGCGGGTLQKGFTSLLSFLGAAAESYPDGENANLFPVPVVKWAAANSDNIATLVIGVEETPNLIEE